MFKIFQLSDRFCRKTAENSFFLRWGQWVLVVGRTEERELGFSLNGKSRQVQSSYCAVLFGLSPEQSQFKSLWWFRQQQLCSVSEPSGDSEHWPSLQLSSRRNNIEEILPFIDIKKNYWHRMKWFSIIELISSRLYFILILHFPQLRVIPGGKRNTAELRVSLVCWIWS